MKCLSDLAEMQQQQGGGGRSAAQLAHLVFFDTDCWVTFSAVFGMSITVLYYTCRIMLGGPGFSHKVDPTSERDNFISLFNFFPSPIRESIEGRKSISLYAIVP